MSSFSLLVLSPVLGSVAVLVRLLLGPPILFRQARIGYNGQTFEIVKFRTMTDAKDVNSNPLPDAERLTRFGSLLRRTSIDELPELWHVLLGQMSLVGPRPLLPEYLRLYTARQAIRHSVLPGLTGLAQVRGRNLLTWEEKFNLDVWYIQNWSLTLDLRIMALTVAALCRGQGINHPGDATSSRFTGSVELPESRPPI